MSRATLHHHRLAAPSTPTTRSAMSTGTLTVTPAALTITADNQSKVYGAALPTLTAVVHGLRQRRHAASLTTQPTLTTTATASSQRRQSLRHHRQRRRRFRLHDQLCERYADRHHRRSNDHGRQPDQGLRCRAADADRRLHRLRQRRHLRQPDDPAHADHDGHRQQPCRGQSLRHHRQRRGRCRLLDHVCRGEPHRHHRAADDHGEQPDQGLRRGVAYSDGQLHGLRQRRQLRQPDDSAHADDDGHRQQPCRGQSLHDHRQRCGRFRLLDHVCRGKPHRHHRATDDHRQQPDQGLRRAICQP